jgi:hypothetical protein
MKKATKRKVTEQWLWEPRPLMIFVGAWVLICVLGTLVTYAFVGGKSLHLLWCISVGLLFGVVYGGVGYKVGKLRRQAAGQGLEAIPGLIVSGFLQCPGVIILKEDVLHLQGIGNKATVVTWPEITAYREVRWFNGTLLLTKTGFWFTVAGKDRLGVALADSSAALLRERLQHTSSQASLKR